LSKRWLPSADDGSPPESKFTSISRRLKLLNILFRYNFNQYKNFGESEFSESNMQPLT
jgi:hypothetical protein